MIIDNFVSHTSPLPAARCWRGRTHSSQSVIRSVHPTLPCILGRAVNETSRKFSLFSKKASWHVVTRDTGPGPAPLLSAGDGVCVKAGERLSRVTLAVNTEHDSHQHSRREKLYLLCLQVLIDDYVLR